MTSKRNFDCPHTETQCEDHRCTRNVCARQIDGETAYNATTAKQRLRERMIRELLNIPDGSPLP
jgi:hypothetical protein